MNSIDEDDVMSPEHVELYLNSLVHQFKSFLNAKVKKIEANGAKITYRKMKRLKKAILFTFAETRK